jgi:magnesium and cobalt exporter, CNNM family
MSLTLVIIISVCALLLEGFFSGSEIAMVSVDKLAIERLAQNNNKGAKLALNLLENSNKLLAVTLIGTNLAVVTNTIVVTQYFLGTSGVKGELYALLIMSPTILLFGEIIPKSIYQQNALKLVPGISYILNFFLYLFWPLIFLVNLFSKSAVSLLGVSTNRARALSRDDLKLLLSEENEKKESEVQKSNLESIKESEREIIGNILNLRDTTVEQVMVPLSEVVSVSEKTTLSELVKLVDLHGYTRFPVYKNRIDNIVGVCHSYNILNAMNLSQSADSIMKPPIFVPEFQKAFKLLVDLQKARKGLSIVVNEYGGAEGIATIEDVLEEIVGEIEDEFDKPEEIIKKIGKNKYLLTGRITISQLNEDLELEMDEDEDYDTIAGLILSKLKHMPGTGEEIIVDKIITLKIIEMSDRAILKIKLTINKKVY